jgi:hypothetical protein
VKVKSHRHPVDALEVVCSHIIHARQDRARAV